MRYHSDEEVAAILQDPVDLHVLAPVLGTTDPAEILRRAEIFMELSRERRKRDGAHDED